MSEVRQYGIVPISTRVISESMPEYRSMRDKVSRMASQGQLIRLKRGLFVVDPEVSQQELSSELIANHIYGPSYVSFQSALSYYGLIPERVFAVQSVVMKRARVFENVLGRFEYVTMPVDYYSIGVRQEIIENNYAFLIASPEKALCDLIIATSGLRIQSQRAMREYLYDDLRIDEDEHPEWDLEIIRECIHHGRKRRELRFLLQVLENG